MNYLNMGGFNTPRRAYNPVGMAMPNGAQNRAPAFNWNPSVNNQETYDGRSSGGGAYTQTQRKDPWWNDESYNDTPWGKDDTVNKLLRLGFGAQADWQRFIGDWAQPEFMSSLKDAYGMVNPTAGASRFRNFRNAAVSNATESGDRQATELASLGFSPSAQAGVKTNAMNQAEEQANQVWQQELDPYQMQLKKLGLLSKAGENPQQQYYAQLLGLANPPQQDDSPTFLESALGILGGLF